MLTIFVEFYGSETWSTKTIGAEVFAKPRNVVLEEK